MAKKWSDLTRRASNARAQKLAANPATRSQIPTSRLKGFAGADELRAERAKNERLNAPFVPGSSTTVRDVAREREAAVGMQYGDTERQLGQQARDSAYQRDTRIPAWYADYQAQLAQGTKELQAANAAANAQVQALATGNTALTGQMSNVAGAQQQASQLGAAADPNAAAREQDASRIRNMLSASFGGMLATQGNNRVGQSIDTRTRIVPAARIQAQTAEQGRLSGIQDNQSQLQKAKGDFRTKYTQDARDAATKSVLEAALFELNANDKAADNELAAKKVSSDIDIKRGVDPVTGKKIVKPKSASERKTQADLDFFKKHGYYPPTGAPSDKSNGKDRYGNTEKERRNAKNNYSTAKATANKYKGGVNGDWKLLRDFIIDKGVKEPMATAAAQEAILGKVGPNTQKSMAEIGVSIANKKAAAKVPSTRNAPSAVKGQERPT